MNVLLLLLYIFVISPVTLAKSFTMEIELIPMERESTIRAMASGERATNFKSGDKLFASFCLKKESTVNVSNIRFSNDGGSDIVNILLNGESLCSFMSTSNSNGGNNWNVFSEVSVCPEVTLMPGTQVIEYIFFTDKYGIELDSFVVEVGDETLDDDFFRCVPVCDANIKYSEIIARDDIKSATLVQQSHTTFCVKDRNINYNLFHDSVSEYRITASPPRYRTLLNDNMAENFACEPVSDVLWEFSNFSVLPGELSQTMGGNQLSFGGNETNRDITVEFRFKMDDFTRMSDEDVGAVLTLKIKDPVPSFTVTLTYSSRNGDQTNVVPTSVDDGTVSWEIPTFTWIEAAQNMVTVAVSVSGTASVMAESFELKRKQKLADTKTTIYEDGMTKIEVVKEDQWWRSPSSMSVKLRGQTQTYSDITRVAVWKVNRFAEGFNEIVQINQDGAINMKPMIPHGAKSVPFGTSIIVGQFNSSEVRPYAGIAVVIIDPFSLTVNLGYVNSNVATLEINSKLVNTEIHVQNASFTEDRQIYPIAAIRSTWASDGNGDIDRVSANLNEPRPPIRDWKTLYGTSFAFFRQCVSLHNTQAPDLVLELLNSEDEDSTESV